jgi:23S rRNA pseudouridine2457 synthase
MEIEKPRYFIVNKPMYMLSQFVGNDPGDMLGKLNYNFPDGTNAIGRLDYESEGLLILTNNKRITRLLFQSKTPHKRTYIVQANGVISEEQIEQLCNGVPILLRGNKMWTTSPCEVERIDQPKDIKNLLHPNQTSTWLKMTLVEGKYRQIRKMITAINRKCKRLIRVSIEAMELDGLAVGEVREYSHEEFFSLLNLKND